MATIHGQYIYAKEHPSIQAHFCPNSNIYVFTVYEEPFYKMTAITLQQAQASTAPASVDKHIQATKGSLDITSHTTVCNMWEGRGYETKSGDGYDLKDVKVETCGSCI